MTAMLASDLVLHLPKQPKVATRPPEARGMARDEVKLLVLNKETGRTEHARFFDLPRFLNAGDLLVVNDSATVPARITARTNSGEFFIHLALRMSQREFIVERRAQDGGADSRPFVPGEVLELIHPNDKTTLAACRIEERFHNKSRLWRVVANCDLYELAQAAGIPIQYGYVKGTRALGEYQTIFAKNYGSAEMPSAARPFTVRTVHDLKDRGVEICALTLHTGVSSHEVETDLASHPVIPEWYNIPTETARAVNEARRQGRRIVAVGTTVVRALESAVLDSPNGQVREGSRFTTHLVTPDTPPQVVTGLITGLHESQSSHLALLYGFVHPVTIKNAYAEATELDYLWHEFGDSNLIL